MADTSDLIGRVFDSRYQIIDSVGRGGMGVVYKALHIAMNQVVALKVLSRDLSGDERTVQRFYQEARASSRLKHPNTIKVFDFGRSEEGHLYLAMEFLDGFTLTQLLRQERVLPVRRAVNIARQIAKSLGEAHLNGLVHRDLKPDNIFITRIYGEEDFVKVLDFGIAKFQDAHPEQEPLTQAGMVCGTPLYLSPEQALGRSLDGRSDLYSLGAILYEMVSGLPPFRGDSPVALVMKHIHDAPPPMTDHNPRLVVPPALQDLIARLLDKDRERRPGTGEDLLKALDGVVAQGGFPEEPSRDLLALDPIGKTMGRTRVETPMVDGIEFANPAPAAAPTGRPVTAPHPVRGKPRPAALVDNDASTAFLPDASPAAAADAATAFLQRDGQTPPSGRNGSSTRLERRPTVTHRVVVPEEAGVSGASGLIPARTPVQTRPPGPGNWVWGIVVAALVLGILSGALGAYLGWFGAMGGHVPAGGVRMNSPVPQLEAVVPTPPPTPVATAPAPAPQPAPTPAPAAAPARTVTVRLDSEPAGAEVLVDERPAGLSPVSLALREGDAPARIRLRAAGFRDLEVLLSPGDVIASGTTSFRYEMQPESAPSPAQAARPPTRSPVPKEVAAPAPSPRPEPKPKAATAAEAPKPVAPKPVPKPPVRKPVLNWDE